jgi:ribose transport system substrate-binding protein
MARWRVLALGTVAILATACSSGGTKTPAAAGSSTSASVSAPAAATGSTSASPAAPGKKLKIALANSFIGNKWRIEMANVFTSACGMPPYKDTVDCTVFHSGNDVGKQTQQITNLISQGVDAIALDAASPTGLNGIVKQACQKGIVVVAFDNTVTEPCAFTVNIDQKAAGAAMAQFLIDKMPGGKGNVVMVTGVAGTSVDEDRNAGAKEAFTKAGVKIVAEYTGMWDSATAERNTATQLPSMPKQIDGLWVSGGTDGVLKAFKAAGRTLPPTAGESENGFRKMMAAGEVQGFSTGTPPFLSVMALEAARAMVTGEIKKSNIVIKYPVVTNDLVKEGESVFADQADSFFTTFTDAGATPAVKLCVQGAVDGKPCPGDIKVNLGATG